MVQVTLKDMPNMIEFRMPFKGNSVLATWDGNLYCVYSYGFHFPMYVYDMLAPRLDDKGNICGAGLWLGNSDKYSTTTTRHQNKCRPRETDKWLSTDGLKDVIRKGSYVEHLIWRSEPEVVR
jgi:hypothetical protein